MHKTRARKEGEVPVLSWDYGFLGGKGHESRQELEEMAVRLGWSPVLCLRERTSGGCYWYLVPRRGTDFESFGSLLNKIVHDLDCMGYKRVCFRSDNDAALCRVLDHVKEKWSGEVGG